VPTAEGVVACQVIISQLLVSLFVVVFGAPHTSPNEWPKGHFTHETVGPWPSHFKHSHWWERRSRSKFATSHYAWGTNELSMWMQDGCKVCMVSYMALCGSCFMVTWILFKNSSFGDRLNTKAGGLRGTPNTHNCWFILVCHVWGPRMIRNLLKWHFVEGPVTYDFTLHLRVHDHTTWFRKCQQTSKVYAHV
jgi:hypothetical protein